MRTAFVFPGQGTQRPGMGGWLATRSVRAADVFASASAIAGFDIAKLCTANDPSVLRRTENAQPALFTVSAAGLEFARERGLSADVFAGHSVGEFNALVAVGCLDFGSALGAVCRRAQLMSAVTCPGTMAAIVGLPEHMVTRLCAAASELGPTTIGLVNAPDYFVVSGAVEGVQACVRAAREAGATRVSLLEVAGAFHSPLMDEAAADWRAVVDDLPLAPPDAPLVLNTTGTYATDVASIRGAMVDQLTSTVEWLSSMRTMLGAGVECLVEIGDSKTLASLGRLVDRRRWRCTTLESLTSRRPLDRMAAPVAP